MLIVSLPSVVIFRVRSTSRRPAMGTEGFPRELGTQLRQDLTFSLHADSHARTKQVLEAVAAAVTLRELRSVRPAGMGRFFITVNSLRAVDRLRALGALTIGGSDYPLVSLASKMKLVTVLHLPTELPDSDLDQVLSGYGRVMKSHRERYKDYPTVETGARKVLLEVTREVPNFISVRGFQGMCLYAGMRKVCRRCSAEGHFAADCSTPRCRRCLEYGHEAIGCEEKCRKCGGDHWTSRCRVTTYASVANEDAMATEDPPSGAYTEELRSHEALLDQGSTTPKDNEAATEDAIAPSKDKEDAIAPSKEINEKDATAPSAEINTEAPSTAVSGNTEEEVLAIGEHLSNDGSLCSEPPLVIDEEALASDASSSTDEPPVQKRPHSSDSQASSALTPEDQPRTANGVEAKGEHEHKKARHETCLTVISAPANLLTTDDESALP